MTAAKDQQSIQDYGLLPASSGACYLCSAKKTASQSLVFVLCMTLYSSASSAGDIC